MASIVEALPFCSFKSRVRSILGFAILNWMARANLIGGIYSRPVALGNFVHFAVVAVTLVKAVAGGTLRNSEVLAASIVYSVFAAGFGWIVFNNPRPRS